MDYDISDYLERLLNESGSRDIAEAELERNLADDPALRANWRAWCAERGYAERTGFDEFCSELNRDRAERWESLADEAWDELSDHEYENDYDDDNA